MTMMPRDRALTIITDNQLKGWAKGYFKSPCIRALNLHDGVKGYARLLNGGYLFVADERQKRAYYGFSIYTKSLQHTRKALCDIE